MDAIGLLPLFINLTEGMDKKLIRKIIVQSMITAIAVALIFVAVGTGIFRLLNISVADFMIAGGSLLFIISIRDILAAEKRLLEVDPDSVGAVPIGVRSIIRIATLDGTCVNGSTKSTNALPLPFPNLDAPCFMPLARLPSRVSFWYAYFA